MHTKWAASGRCGGSRECETNRSVANQTCQGTARDPWRSAGCFNSADVAVVEFLVAVLGWAVESDRPRGLVLKVVVEER